MTCVEHINQKKTDLNDIHRNHVRSVTIIIQTKELAILEKEEIEEIDTHKTQMKEDYNDSI